jgi:lactate permease
MVPWMQVYDPLHSAVASTLAAMLPIVLLLAMIASGKIKAHVAAVIALGLAIVVAAAVFTMPLGMALRATGLGILSGLFPIGWIILNVIFLYRLTVEKGWFAILQASISGVTADRRLQLLLIAFCFGAFFEGAAGFGTPIAVTAAMLMGLGFSPLAASGLSLIANTAPVAFGALGAPIQGLATATGIDPHLLGQMIGRQLPVFSVIVPFWLVAAFAGWRGMMQVWPAILVTGVSFAVPQFLISNFLNPWIVDIGASAIAMACLVLFLKVWRPKQIWTEARLRGKDISATDTATDTAPNTAAAAATNAAPPTAAPSAVATAAGAAALPTANRSAAMAAWMPWALLCAVLLLWGSDAFKTAANAAFSPAFPVTGLHNLVLRAPPVVPAPAAEAAVFKFTFLSYTGAGILLATILAGLLMGFSPLRLARAYAAAFWALRYPLITIAANSSGGVMGKMVDTQSIVVASTATAWFGHEAAILRFVFWRSVVLAGIVGVLVMLQAYVWPFTASVVR